MRTISARELNRDVSAAKRAATAGPVVITDRGEPAFVLLAINDYRRLVGSGADLVEQLRMVGDAHGADDIDIEFGPLPSAFSLKAPAL